MDLAGFHARWFLSVVIQPALMICLVGLVYLMMRFKDPFHAKLHAKGLLFFVIFFCYPTMNSVALESFICIVLTDKKSLLSDDDKVFCEDSKHMGYQIFSLLVVLVVGIAIPLLFGWTLWRKSKAHKLTTTQKTRVNELHKELNVPISAVESVAAAVSIGKGYSFLMDVRDPCHPCTMLRWACV
jgi:hypothetical protein